MTGKHCQPYLRHMLGPVTSSHTVSKCSVCLVQATAVTCFSAVVIVTHHRAVVLVTHHTAVVVVTRHRHHCDAGIERCYIVEADATGPTKVQTDGINFTGVWAHSDLIDVDNITTNDVGSTLRMYGVEAARATLMREVRAVFGAYGIGVDPRHLGLIADFMTHMVKPSGCMLLINHIVLMCLCGSHTSGKSC